MSAEHHRSALAQAHGCTAARAVSRGVVLCALALGLGAGCTAGAPESTGGDRTEPASPLGAGTPMSPGLRSAAIRSIQEGAADTHRFEAPAPDGTIAARRAAHGWQVAVRGETLRITPQAAAAWQLGLRWVGLGRGDDVRPVAQPSSAPLIEHNRVSIDRADGSGAWFLNGPLGVEHGYLLPLRPPGTAGPVVLALELTGDLVPVLSADGQQLVLRDRRGSPVVRYSDLDARDATGRRLAAQMSLRQGVLVLSVEDADARYPLRIDPLVWAEIAKLTATNGADGDQLGVSVAIAGSTAIVGAPEVAGGTGAAYVFGRNQGGLDQWGEVKMITAGDAQAGDHFGQAVGVSGLTAIVGAPDEDTVGSNGGAAYVFARHEGGTDNWGQLHKLTASDGQAGDRFGAAVTADGDTGIVGAPAEDGGGTDRGAAYVFHRQQGGWDNWGQVTKIAAGDGADGDELGAAVALAGDTAFVGAPGVTTSTGAAYVFDRNQGGTDAWGQVRKLAASDPQSGDRFGEAVAVSGDTGVVGAPSEDGGGTDRGAAYVFERDEGGTNNWGQVVKLVASDTANGSEFGAAVAVSADAAIVGAPSDGAGSDRGAAYVFDRNEGGANNWGEVDKLAASDPEDGDRFGGAMAMSIDTAIIAAALEDGAGTDRGAAYAWSFRLTDGERCDSAQECQSLICVEGVCCNDLCGDDDPTDCMSCTLGGGSSTEGVCETFVDGHECDDGVYCNGVETCTAGVCGGSPGDPCVGMVGDLDNDCSESCDEAADRCSAVDPDGTDCTDGLACNGADQCQNGECAVHETECPGAGGSSAASSSGDDGGCGCRVPSRTPARLPHGALVGLGLAAAAARRRRSTREPWR